jgi:hypothetical protein
MGLSASPVKMKHLERLLASLTGLLASQGRIVILQIIQIWQTLLIPWSRSYLTIVCRLRSPWRSR